MVIDTFVQELKTYVQMRLSNRISINCSFILDFQGRLEDKLKASLDKLAKGSNSLAQSLALQQTRGNCSTDIDSWDLSTLINIFKEYYLDCFGKFFQTHQPLWARDRLQATDTQRRPRESCSYFPPTSSPPPEHHLEGPHDLSHTEAPGH